MHESRLVSDLIDEAERRMSVPQPQIRTMTFRIGALASVTPDALRHGVGQHATARWGQRPEIVIDRGHDPTAPDALGVVLVSMTVVD